MSLSVCLITVDPASRLRAALAPLREFADEVVIAADHRVDAATLAAYSALADKLVRIEYRMAERHLAWLLNQCSGDWILRMDGDEVPSARFLRRLPELLESREVRQFWTRTSWLYPDGEHELASEPWGNDFHVRLLRNDAAQRSRGIQHHHVEPAWPLEYLEEPFYHLDLLLTNRQQRREKAIRYEAARPGLLAAGGGNINDAFYLPELRGSSLKRRSLPDEDRERVARALSPPTAPEASEAAGPKAAGIDEVPFVSLTEMDRFWEQRTIPESAYRASFEPLRQGLSLAPSEHRPLFFYVTNEGSERWPGGLEIAPLIRIGCRWLNPDGSAHGGEGPRSPLPRGAAPGERVLMPVHVHAPDMPGDYVLEIDAVHEHVRWFDSPWQGPVHVHGPQGLPLEERLQATTRPHDRRRAWMPKAAQRTPRAATG